MVTDSIQYERDFGKSSEKNPTLVRTFILRGYDASDEEVDREGLLNVICTASPVSILKNEDTLVQVHEGMLSIAQELFRELESYIDMTSPSHKIVFTG
jgi:membrane-bound ClpP family serine protease